MVSSISFSSSISSHCTKGDLAIGCLLLTCINQIAIYHLKKQTFEKIKNIPLKPLPLESEEAIRTTIEENNNRNQSILALLRTQNTYKLYSVAFSCAVTAFSIFNNLFPLQYGLLIFALQECLGARSNWNLIHLIEKKYTQRSHEALTAAALKELNNPSCIVLQTSTRHPFAISSIKHEAERETQQDIDALEVNTRGTNVRPIDQPFIYKRPRALSTHSFS